MKDMLIECSSQGNNSGSSLHGNVAIFTQKHIQTIKIEDEAVGLIIPDDSKRMRDGLNLGKEVGAMITDMEPEYLDKEHSVGDVADQGISASFVHDQTAMAEPQPRRQP